MFLAHLGSHGRRPRRPLTGVVLSRWEHLSAGARCSIFGSYANRSVPCGPVCRERSRTRHRPGGFHPFCNPIPAVKRLFGPAGTHGFGEFCSTVCDIAQSNQRCILRSDSDHQNRRIRDREDQRVPRQAKAKRQDGDLADNDGIIWM
jgi:hypothetical protein